MEVTSPTVPTANQNSIPNSTCKTKPGTPWRAAQNISLLPFWYGSQLDKDLACQDALYALSEIFNFTSSSKVQFLNLMHTRIEHELSFVGHEDTGTNHAVSLLNLKYIKTQLGSHAQNLTETVSTLENRHTLDWPRNESSPTTEQVTALLLTDYK